MSYSLLYQVLKHSVVDTVYQKIITLPERVEELNLSLGEAMTPTLPEQVLIVKFSKYQG